MNCVKTIYFTNQGCHICIEQKYSIFSFIRVFVVYLAKHFCR